MYHNNNNNNGFSTADGVNTTNGDMSVDGKLNGSHVSRRKFRDDFNDI